jgi:hypothetical protein
MAYSEASDPLVDLRRRRLRRLIAEKGYDTDRQRADRPGEGITPIIPGTQARKRRISHDKRQPSLPSPPAGTDRAQTLAASKPVPEQESRYGEHDGVENPIEHLRHAEALRSAASAI